MLTMLIARCGLAGTVIFLAACSQVEPADGSEGDANISPPLPGIGNFLGYYRDYSRDGDKIDTEKLTKKLVGFGCPSDDTTLYSGKESARPSTNNKVVLTFSANSTKETSCELARIKAKATVVSTRGKLDVVTYDNNGDCRIKAEFAASGMTGGLRRSDTKVTITQTGTCDSIRRRPYSGCTADVLNEPFDFQGTYYVDDVFPKTNMVCGEFTE